MNGKLLVSRAIVEQTLVLLSQAGLQQHECVVLWLGERANDHVVVTEVMRPDQVADSDFFHIPRASMQAILRKLDESGLFIASQVHSHPEEAFHSRADDKWAIVRHVGALSIVVPHFASSINVDSFIDGVAVFELDSANRWIEVPGQNRGSKLELR